MATKDSSASRTVILLAIAAVLGLFGVWRIIKVSRPPNVEKEMLTLQTRIGREVGKLAGQAFNGQGRILVIRADSGVFTDNMAAKLDESLRKALKKAGSFDIVAEIDPRATPAAGAERASVPGAPKGLGAGLSADYFSDLAKQYPNLDGIVSLAGDPRVPAGQLAALKDKIPPMVCLSLDGDRLPDLFKAGIVKGAVAPKRKGTDPEAKADSFDIQFEVVKPDTVEQWWNP